CKVWRRKGKGACADRHAGSLRAGCRCGGISERDDSCRRRLAVDRVRAGLACVHGPRCHRNVQCPGCKIRSPVGKTVLGPGKGFHRGDPIRRSRPIRVVTLPQTYRPVAVLGWILYGLSWVTPSLDGAHIGAWAFLEALTVGVQLTTHFGSLVRIVAG